MCGKEKHTGTADVNISPRWGTTDRETLTKWKPEMEMFCNKTKGGIDVADVVSSNYDVTQTQTIG